MIAERCGLSNAAVSRALNHQPGISEARAEWVRKVAEEMGYYPNTAARTLKTNRSNIIGVIYRNQLVHEFFATILDGIHEEVERCGYELIFLNSSPTVSYYEHARHRQCAGVVVAQSLFNLESVMTLIGSGIPTVFVEDVYPGSTTVVNDNVAAMREVVHYLAEMGHERIALIHGEMGQVTSERLTGFKRGMSDCGLALPEEYVRPARFREPEYSAHQTAALLDLPQPPTCILYPDDISYLGGMVEIERRGLRIPEDVSCFGFDGMSISRLIRPRLSTYHQDAMAMGRAAARQVIAAIEDPRMEEPRTITVPGRILEGETVKDLRK